MPVTHGVTGSSPVRTALSNAHVEHGDARFTAEQTANAGFRRHISQVINARRNGNDDDQQDA